MTPSILVTRRLPSSVLARLESSCQLDLHTEPNAIPRAELLARVAGKDALISVTFDQDYRSDNLSRRTAKRQYWAMERGRWKIAYEGLARSGSVALPESFPNQRRQAGRSP